MTSTKPARVAALLPLLLLTLSCSCLMQSVHPFYLEDEQVEAPRGLEGRWSDKEGTSSWDIRQLYGGTSSEYSLFYEDEKGTAAFTGRLCSFGQALWLDITPAQTDGENVLWALLHAPLHSCWKVELEGDELRFVLVNAEWLMQTLAQAPQSLDHEIQQGAMEGWPLLTAEPQQLRDFLTEHQDEEDFWLEALVLQRQEASAAARW